MIRVNESNRTASQYRNDQSDTLLATIWSANYVQDVRSSWSANSSVSLLSVSFLVQTPSTVQELRDCILRTTCI